MVIKEVPPVIALEPDKATIELFEIVLNRARAGEIKGGIVLAIDPRGGIDHFTKTPPERINELLGAMEAVKFSLLSRNICDEGEEG